MGAGARADVRISDYRLYAWRAKHSRLRGELHSRVAQDVGSIANDGWIVDLGCGPGLLETHLEPGIRGTRLAGVDIDRRMLVLARMERGLEGIQASSANLSFRADTVAVVVSCASIKDWADKEAGLREILRVIKPGGTAFVYEFVTTGPGSRPEGFARRYGFVSEVLRRLMGRVARFTFENARSLRDAIDDRAEVVVELEKDMGVVRMTLRNRIERASDNR